MWKGDKESLYVNVTTEKQTQETSTLGRQCHGTYYEYCKSQQNEDIWAALEYDASQTMYIER